MGVTKKKIDGIIAGAAVRDAQGNKIHTTYLRVDSPLVGKTIRTITKTATSGLVDTYTITFTDDTTWDYYVTNGKDGTDGAKGDKGDTGLGITDVNVNSNNQIVATMSDGSTKTTSALTTVKSLNNMTGDVTIAKGDIDLGNVENKSTATIKSEFTGSVAANNTGFVTGGAVKTYVDNAIGSLPEPMIFKGTLGTGGTVTSLPTAASSNEGFTYKVITAGTYASQSAKVGDVFISNGSAWALIPAGDDVEDTWRQIKVNGTSLLNTGISTGAVNFKSGTNVTVSGSGNDITISSTDTDTGATSVAVSGSGNAVSDASYDASTRKITLTKGVTLLTSHQTIKTLKTDNTTAQTTSSSEAIAGSGTINLHKVAKTGNYGDLIGKPSLATVATSGSYNDLTNKPTIPTVNNATLTIQKNGTTVKTFTSNAASDVTANITVPTTLDDISDGSTRKLTNYYLASNPSGYTSNAGTVTSVTIKAGTGLSSSSESAITTSGTRTISIASGYKLPTSAEGDFLTSEHEKTLNLFGNYIFSSQQYVTVNSRGANSVNATVNNASYSFFSYDFHLDAGSYVLSFDANGDAERVIIGSNTTYFATGNYTIPFTVVSSGNVTISFGGQIGTTDITHLSINAGSTALPYHPHDKFKDFLKDEYGKTLNLWDGAGVGFTDYGIGFNAYLKPSTTYTISFSEGAFISFGGSRLLINGTQVVNYGVMGNPPITFTTPSNLSSGLSNIAFEGNYTSASKIDLHPMVSEGSSALEYKEPDDVVIGKFISGHDYSIINASYIIDYRAKYIELSGTVFIWSSATTDASSVINTVTEVVQAIKLRSGWSVIPGVYYGPARLAGADEGYGPFIRFDASEDNIRLGRDYDHNGYRDGTWSQGMNKGISTFWGLRVRIQK